MREKYVFQGIHVIFSGSQQGVWEEGEERRCKFCFIGKDLIAGLKKLVKKATTDKKPLDGVIIETTGLADPAPVAQTFFADSYVQEKYSLDGILTLVDSKHLVQHLEEEKPEGVENEAVEQIAFADRILLNKCDLSTAEELDEVERRILANLRGWFFDYAFLAILALSLGRA